ncbi:ABC transporter ATP-binding protein [Paracoccus cavernae]|uniref:ABC transporter ATP-binding protein n=1 Tax=Paracoccus cavernae TaxID=1571207 RepID=A0ABT8DC36_9RHOB|nr:ABC transporter ATP-binding protein [Paracoccus cavernae]
MSSLSIQSLTKSYGELTIVKSVSLDVAEGEFLSLLGPSGCGKTTILRMVAGLLPPSGGRIIIGGKDVTTLPPNKRDIGLVFQSYALFPQMTVFDNIAFGLRRQGVKGTELDRRVMEALDQVRLTQMRDRYPRQLSGGQQQRVALARSIAPKPGILLFDEPLSNLDAQLREEMQIEIKRLQTELRLTSVFVTHDQHEAMSLSDRICLLEQGAIQQIGTPEEIYFTPANGFVAGFVGSPNKLSGRVSGGRLHLAEGLSFSHAAEGFADGTPVTARIRQEDVAVAASGASSSMANSAVGASAVPARIAMRIFEGASVQLVLSLAGGTEILARIGSRAPLASFPEGSEVLVFIAPDRIHLSQAEG